MRGVGYTWMLTLTILASSRSEFVQNCLLWGRMSMCMTCLLHPAFRAHWCRGLPLGQKSVRCTAFYELFKTTLAKEAANNGYVEVHQGCDGKAAPSRAITSRV